MFSIFFSKLVNFLNQDYDRSKYNMFFGAFISLIGHPFYWLICVYYIEVNFDSVFFRFSSSLSSLLVFILLYYTEKYPRVKPYTTLYWYVWVMWILPITFTYITLMNDISKLWLVAETMMIFLVILFVANIIVIILILCAGIGLGYFFFKINAQHLLSISMGEFFNILTLLPLAIICGTLFLAKAKEGDFDKRKANLFKFLAGSIAHELRNPLNRINAIMINLENFIDQMRLNQPNSLAPEKNIATNNKIAHLNEKKIKILSDYIESVCYSLKDANNIIDLVLSDISEKNIDESQFVFLTPKDIVDIIQKYYYMNKTYNDHIKFEILDPDKFNNLHYKIIHQRFYYVFNNIIKNSLYYLNQFSDIIVKIGFDQQIINGKKFNVINFIDNGPGIESNKIDKLFKDFSTFSKKGGTGLGLSFCKKNMKIFGGDIVCSSEFGNGQQGWTKFSLLFPYPSEEEIEKTNQNLNKKKILLVDDHKINLIALKSKIERLMPNIICEIANSGKEAIAKTENNKYNLILMDIQMPDINGIEASRRIKRSHNSIPIIAATSLSFESLNNELISYNNLDLIEDYISKNASNNHLARTIAKHLSNYEDDFLYLNSDKNFLLENLQGKKFIIADDQELNLIMVKKILEKYQISCAEAHDGNGIIDLYSNSLDDNKNSYFDAIITDINMMPMNGYQAAKTIRKIEKENKIKYKERIKIIAITGDSSSDIIANYFKSGIDDYFIKGNNFDNLVKIILNAITNIDPNDSSSPLDGKNLRALDDINTKKDYKIFDHKFISYFSPEEQLNIIKLFIDEGNLIIAKIKKNYELHDFEKLTLNIHSLKGISANIGAEKLFNYIKYIEKISKSSHQEYNCIIQIEELYAELIDELNKVISNK